MTDTRPFSKWIAAIVVVSFFALYFYVQSERGNQQKLSSPTVFSAETSGVSVFKDLTDSIRPRELEISESAIFEADDLAGRNAVLLFSPSTDLSERESNLLKDYVSNGGTLLISFKDEKVWNENLSALRKTFNITTSIEKSSDFKNGQTENVTADKDSSFFRGGETYSFYSNVHFAGPECTKGSLDCFVQEEPFGKGKIIFLAGFPLVSNALIGRTDNQKFAFRLIMNSPKILIDEYHHFFSSKTLADLLVYPPFLFPVGGLIVGLLLFFILAHTKFSESSLKEQEKTQGQSYHAMGESILERMMNDPGLRQEAVGKHIQYLNNLFPEKKEELRSVLNEMASKMRTEPKYQTFALIRFHKSVLRHRGRKV